MLGAWDSVFSGTGLAAFGSVCCCFQVLDVLGISMGLKEENIKEH